MLLRLVGFIFLATALSACSKDSTPTAPTPSVPASPATVRVSGKVIDYRSGQSIPGYTIRWWTGSGGHLIIPFGTLTSVTDASGTFEVDVPVTEGFRPLEDRLLVDIPMASGQIRIPAKSHQTDLIVNGGPCAARYGYVYDAVTQRPIAGARVVRAGTATTDANGFYRIDIGCEPHDGLYWGIGTTLISVSHPGYQGTSELDGRREGTSYSGIRRVDFALTPA